jgi:hypothetical protein
MRITVYTYGHLTPGWHKAAVDKLDGLENETSRNRRENPCFEHLRKAGINQK